MSTGPVKQFIDYKGTGDTGQNEPTAIQPILNGESVVGGVGSVTNRPGENLRQRSETLKGVLEDLLYLADADRHIFLAGPGTVTWPGASPGSTGVFTLSDVLYLVPALAPGAAQAAPTPPVQSMYGTLTLLREDAAHGLILTSRRRNYEGGDRINVTAVEGAPLAVTVAADERSVTITAPPGTTLAEVRDAVTALTVDTPATQLLTATLDTGTPALETDIFLTTQARQFIVGNYDGEGHTLTGANLATFFTTPANVLLEGDALCVWYAMVNDAPADPPPLGGRRQSTPENGNTTVPVGALFNSRVNPERLVNALPIAKVINGHLCFINGINVPAGAVDVGLNNGAYAGGPAWYDATTNPATTVEGQFDKIITDLIAVAAAHSGADRLGCAPRSAWLGGRTNAAASIFAAIDKVITDLAGVTVDDDGAERIGASAVTDLAEGSVRSQLTTLASDWAKLTRANTFTATQSLETTVEGTPALKTNTVPMVRRLLWEVRTAVSGRSWRIYSTINGAFELVINAHWSVAGWHEDTDGPCYRLVVSAAGLALHSHPAADDVSDTWVDGRWREVIRTGADTDAILDLGAGWATGDDAAAKKTRANSARLSGTCDDTVVAQTLIMEFGATKKFRLYTTAQGQGAFTVNAKWDEVGQAWVSDVDTDYSTLLIIGTTSIMAYRHAGSLVPWSPWTGQSFVFYFSTGYLDPVLADPSPYTSGVGNYLTRNNNVKAWGRIDCINNPPLLTDGFNLVGGSVVFADTTHVQVDIGNSLYSRDNYIVLTGYDHNNNNPTTAAYHVVPYKVDPNTIQFSIHNAAGTIQTIQELGFQFYFIVVGAT